MSHTIVVVEDNPITRKMVMVALRTEGYTVFGAEDGSSAVAMVSEHHPDLVVQDLILPDMDGIELGRRIRALSNGRDCQLIALSGLASKLDEARASGIGFAELLFKPVAKPSKLTNILERLLPRTEPAVTPATSANGQNGKASLERELTTKTAQLSIMAAVASVMAEDRDLTRILNEMLARTLDAAGVPMGAIFLTASDGKPELACQLGYPMASAERLSDFFHQLPLLDQVLISGKPLRVPSTQLGEPVNRRHECADTSGDPLPAWCSLCLLLPLVVAGERLGILVLASDRQTLDHEWVDIALAIGVQIAQAVAHARSIHELKETNEHWRAAAAEAQRANHAKSDFLAVMSHELRTPLNAIVGYADLILLDLCGPLTDDQREKLSRIRRSSGHLLSLINQILDFERVVANREKLYAEPTELRELIQAAAAEIEPQAIAKGLHFTIDPLPESMVVKTDGAKVRQILLNLLSNAVKYTEQGNIRLGLRRLDDTLEIRVNDTGIGIRAEDRDRIFDPFWQADQRLTRRAGGTGLGLSIAQRLTYLLSGDITVDSAPGRGSTFTVRVPLAS